MRMVVLMAGRIKGMSSSHQGYVLEHVRAWPCLGVSIFSRAALTLNWRPAAVGFGCQLWQEESYMGGLVFEGGWQESDRSDLA